MKYRLFLSHFNETCIFSINLRKLGQISNFIKIRPVGAELFHADGWKDRQADMTKLIVAARSFANTSKKSLESKCTPISLMECVGLIHL